MRRKWPRGPVRGPQVQALQALSLLSTGRAPAFTEAPALCFSQPQLQALHPRRKPQHPLSLQGS